GPRREGRHASSGGALPARRAERQALAAFLADLQGDRAAPYDESPDLVSADDQLWLLPAGLELHGITPRRAGAPLGAVRKGRFEPHHAFSRLLPANGEAARHLDLAFDDPRLGAYLRGEALSASVPDGWLLL